MEKDYILLVENSKMGLDVLSAPFKEHEVGYPLVVANGGIEALSILREREGVCQLIVASEMAPRFNGYGFFELMSTKNSRESKILSLLVARLSYLSGSEVFLQAAKEGLPVNAAILASGHSSQSLGFSRLKEEVSASFKCEYISKPFELNRFVELLVEMGLNPVPIDTDLLDIW